MTSTPPPASAHASIDEITAAAQRDRPAHDAAFIVGTVGQDVPLEIIDAAGAVPLRLRGNPAWDTDPADYYLGAGLDPAIRSLMAGILTGAFGRLDAIVVSSDCDASQRLYYVLRELRRVDERVPIPPVHLVDILHQPKESTARYTLARVREFVDVLERWTGSRLNAAGLASAVELRDGRRARQRRVMRLRASVPARLTGTQALAIFAAADRMPPQRYDECLDAIVRDAEALPPRDGTRVFVTGSSHDRDDVYRAIEATGAVIVGEDHDRGALLASRDIRDFGDSVDVLDAIARRYQCNGPTAQRASIPERAAHAAAGVDQAHAEVLLAYVRVMDEAPLWDFAAQRAAARVPSGVVVRQRYGEIDPDALARALGTPHETGVNE